MEFILRVTKLTSIVGYMVEKAVVFDSACAATITSSLRNDTKSKPVPPEAIEAGTRRLRYM